MLSPLLDFARAPRYFHTRAHIFALMIISFSAFIDTVPHFAFAFAVFMLNNISAAFAMSYRFHLVEYLHEIDIARLISFQVMHSAYTSRWLSLHIQSRIALSYEHTILSTFTGLRYDTTAFYAKQPPQHYTEAPKCRHNENSASIRQPAF